MNIFNIILLIAFVSFVKSKTNDSNDTNFVANSEWQEIKPGKYKNRKS